MTTLLRILSLVSAVSWLAPSSVARAQDWGGTGSGDDTDEASGDKTADKPAVSHDEALARTDTRYPMRKVDRPVQLYAGMTEASVELAFPGGPTPTGYGVGEWIGLGLRGAYAVDDNIQAGLFVSLAPASPDFGAGGDTPVFGGVIANGAYKVFDWMSATGELGVAYPPLLVTNGYFPAYTAYDPPGDGGMKLGLSAGVVAKKIVFEDSLSLQGGFRLVVQDSASSDNSGNKTTWTGFQIPVELYYQVFPELAVGLHTGLYSDGSFGFDADKFATLPFILAAMYTLLDGQVDMGVHLGFGSLNTQSSGGMTTRSVVDSFYASVTGTFRIE